MLQNTGSPCPSGKLHRPLLVPTGLCDRTRFDGKYGTLARVAGASFRNTHPAPLPNPVKPIATPPAHCAVIFIRKQLCQTPGRHRETETREWSKLMLFYGKSTAQFVAPACGIGS